MNRGRARSRLAERVAGWLAEWLGVRASRIMGIEGGLSNQNFRFDWKCRYVDRDSSLARQNTLKMIVQKRLHVPDVKTAPPCFRHGLADCLVVRAASSDRKTAANTGRIAMLRFGTWNSPVLRKLALEKSELCKIAWHLESLRNGRPLPFTYAVLGDDCAPFCEHRPNLIRTTSRRCSIP